MIATSQTHFLFSGNYYDKIDGVAMGSPLVPVLANLFMGFHEERWLKNYSGTYPLFYRRYVDDIICVFNDESDATLFFLLFEQKTRKIKFTIELENYGKLAFLDVFIDNSFNSSTFITSIFHKSTYTGLLTIFLRFTSFTYKVGLIRCLIDSAYKINNTVFGFNQDMAKLTEILLSKKIILIRKYFQRFFFFFFFFYFFRCPTSYERAQNTRLHR